MKKCLLGKSYQKFCKNVKSRLVISGLVVLPVVHPTNSDEVADCEKCKFFEEVDWIIVKELNDMTSK